MQPLVTARTARPRNAITRRSKERDLIMGLFLSAWPASSLGLFCSPNIREPMERGVPEIAGKFFALPSDGRVVLVSDLSWPRSDCSPIESPIKSPRAR
jgi:hypothetical protein